MLDERSRSSTIAFRRMTHKALGARRIADEPIRDRFGIGEIEDPTKPALFIGLGINHDDHVGPPARAEAFGDLDVGDRGERGSLGPVVNIGMFGGAAAAASADKYDVQPKLRISTVPSACPSDGWVRSDDHATRTVTGTRLSAMPK